MTSRTELATFVFIVGNQVISGKGYTTSFQTTYFDPVSFQSYGSCMQEVIRVGPCWMDLDVRIRAQNIVISNGEQVSKKLVHDCSIEELIFAITVKAKEQK